MIFASKKNSFIDLNPDLKFAILSKMNNVSLCRMRRASLLVDLLVEHRKERFQQRTELGFDLQVFIDPLNPQAGVQLSRVASRIAYRNPVSLYEYDHLESHFSGITIRHLNIFLPEESKNYADLPNRIIDVFKRIRPICESLEIHGASADIIVAVTDIVSCREGIEITLSERSLATLAELTKAKNCEKFTIRCMNAKDPLKAVSFFDHIKQFKTFEDNSVPCGFNANSLYILLKEIKMAEDPGSLKRMRFTFRISRSQTDLPFPYVDAIWPRIPLGTLWDMSFIPKNLLGVYTPWFIRKIELKEKWVVVCEKISGPGFVDETIYFIEKNPLELLLICLRQLGINDLGRELCEDFLTAKDERRARILRKGFTAQYA